MSQINSPEWLREIARKIQAGEPVGNVQDALLLEQLAVDAEFVRQAGEQISGNLSRFPGVGDQRSRLKADLRSEIAERTL